MFQVVAGRLPAAVIAVAALLPFPGTALAQPPDPAPAAAPPAPLPPGPPVPDPSAPLDPMPDIGVEWPKMEEEGAKGTIAGAPDTGIADAASERAYSWRITGLDPETEADVRTQFASLSSLEQKKKDSANAAQIDRRAREDADLLADLLRNRGYYDAIVYTRVEAAPAERGRVTVTLQAEPGPLYHFAAVNLPGLEGAGEDAAALREAFAVKPDDPVNADRVTAAEAALTAELGKRGYAFADVGDLDV